MEKILNNHKINISSADKILFPETGITKGELIEYYERIAEYMLPHLYNRPLNMQRFPTGIDKAGFYQKDRPDYFPKWIKSIEVEKEGGTVCHVLTNNKATLVYLANQGCITFHTWLSLKDKLHHPDKMIFDLDPDEGNFEAAKKAARIVKEFLERELNLPAYLMTTGSKGLHVVTPLNKRSDFDQVKIFSKKISEIIAHRYPNDFTIEIRKDKRKGRLFLDYLRNAYAQTGVAPFSVRARENAPVATPLSWDELENDKLNAQIFNIRNIFSRLDSINNPWEGFKNSSVGISVAKNKLNKIK
jgi:bifunctional non-homologous end joining protein LigD